MGRRGNPTLNGTWAKGQSGNPKGRPKVLTEVKALAQQYGEEAFNELVRLSKHADDERVRLSAIKELLDRAYGKPAQSVELGGPGGEPLQVAVTISLKSADKSKS